MTEGAGARSRSRAFEQGARGERRRDPVEHGLRLRRDQGRHPVRERRAEPDRRHPGAAGAGGEDQGAAGRQGHEDRADADQDDHRARASRRACSACDGWYSTNILGNRDGEVLDDPESFKTKEESKKSVLDYILQPHLYPELYKDLTTSSASTTTRRAATTRKAGTTSTSSAGSATRCSSRSTSCAATASWRRRSCSTRRCSSTWRSARGCHGIQEWLSFYFKSPMHAPELYPEHDLFIQLMKLKNTLRYMTGRRAHHAPRPRVLRLIRNRNGLIELRCRIPTRAWPAMSSRLQPALLAGSSSACCRRCRSSARELLLRSGSWPAACWRPSCCSRTSRTRSRSATARSSACSPASSARSSGLIALRAAPGGDRRAAAAVRRADPRVGGRPAVRLPADPGEQPDAGRLVFGLAFGFLVMLFVGLAFATLGGLIGALLFRMRRRRQGRWGLRRRRRPRCAAAVHPCRRQPSNRCRRARLQ